MLALPLPTQPLHHSQRDGGTVVVVEVVDVVVVVGVARFCQKEGAGGLHLHSRVLVLVLEQSESDARALP